MNKSLDALKSKIIIHREEEQTNNKAEKMKKKSINSNSNNHNNEMPEDDFFKNEDDATKFAEQLRLSLPIRDRVHHLNKYPSCFVGSDAVKSIMKLRPEIHDIAGAEKLGQSMLESKIIYHVTKSKPFKNNSKYYYRFKSSAVQDHLRDSLNNTAATSQDFSSKHTDYSLLSLAMKLNESLDIRDRKHRLKNYSNCFCGSDAVKLMIHEFKEAADSEEAEEIGQMMMEKNIIYHVTREHPFKNKDSLYYRFATEEDAVPREVETRATLPRLSKMLSRRSFALGEISVRCMTLNDVSEVDCVGMKPIRILVTMPGQKSGSSRDKNMAMHKGLGPWVCYILSEFLESRNIPAVVFLKSIVLGEKEQSTITTTPTSLLKTKLTSVTKIQEFIQRNKIDILIPTDVDDTQFVARNIELISPLVRMAITPSASIYQKLEDKWETYLLMKEIGVQTPHTEKLEGSTIAQSFPFFVKVSSRGGGGGGCGGGGSTSSINSSSSSSWFSRWVWFIRDEDELKYVLQINKKQQQEGLLMLAQKPISGTVTCAQIIYNHGRVLGFFFAQPVQQENLSFGVGFQNSISEYRDPDDYSHEKVILTDQQWQAVTTIFKRLGEGTKYHGMIDIEFIVADGENGDGIEEGSVWLLECNPRFSGDIHTTLSNPGFLDTYFDLICDRVDPNDPIKNFSASVDMQSTFSLFKPLHFFKRYPGVNLNIRKWSNDSSIRIHPDLCCSVQGGGEDETEEENEENVLLTGDYDR